MRLINKNKKKLIMTLRFLRENLSKYEKTTEREATNIPITKNLTLIGIVKYFNDHYTLEKNNSLLILSSHYNIFKLRIFLTDCFLRQVCNVSPFFTFFVLMYL